MLIMMTMMMLRCCCYYLTFNGLTCNCLSFISIWFYIRATCLNCFIALLTMLMIFSPLFFGHSFAVYFRCLSLCYKTIRKKMHNKDIFFCLFFFFGTSFVLLIRLTLYFDNGFTDKHMNVSSYIHTYIVCFVLLPSNIKR